MELVLCISKVRRNSDIPTNKSGQRELKDSSGNFKRLVA